MFFSETFSRLWAGLEGPNTPVLPREHDLEQLEARKWGQRCSGSNILKNRKQSDWNNTQETAAFEILCEKTMLLSLFPPELCDDARKADSPAMRMPRPGPPCFAAAGSWIRPAHRVPEYLTTVLVGALEAASRVDRGWAQKVRALTSTEEEGVQTAENK